MKKLLLLILVILIGVISFAFWRISATESALKNSIQSISIKENKASVDAVSIHLLGNSTHFSNLEIPYDSTSSVSFSSLDIKIGWFNLLRFIVFDSQKALSQSDSFSLDFEEFFLSHDGAKFQLAAKGKAVTTSTFFEMIKAFQTNKMPTTSWSSSLELVDVSSWQANTKSNLRETSVPLFDTVSLRIGFQAGLSVADISILGKSSTSAEMHFMGKAFYSPLSSLNKPDKTTLDLIYNGEIPSEIPIPGLHKSWFKTGNSSIQTSATFTKNELTKLDAQVKAKDILWQAPPTWPPHLAPAYFIFGSNPSPTPIDSLSLNISSDDKTLFFNLVGAILTIDGKIIAKKQLSNDDFAFEKSDVLIHFKTMEAANLAHSLQVMTGFINRKKPVSNNVNLQITGTLKSPKLTVLN